MLIILHKTNPENVLIDQRTYINASAIYKYIQYHIILLGVFHYLPEDCYIRVLKSSYYYDNLFLSAHRAQKGIPGWRTGDKTEVLSCKTCNVYSANNVQLVNLTRTEHLSASEKERFRGHQEQINSFSARNPLLGLFSSFTGQSAAILPPPTAAPAAAAGAGTTGSAESSSSSGGSSAGPSPQHPAATASTSASKRSAMPPVKPLSWPEYLNPNVLFEGHVLCDVPYVPVELTRKLQKFNLKLWLAEERSSRCRSRLYPLWI